MMSLVRIVYVICFVIFSIPSFTAVKQVNQEFQFTLYHTDVLCWQDGRCSGPVANKKGPVAQAFEKFINKAKTTMDMAIYGVLQENWFLQDLQKILIRGVTIRATVDQTGGTWGTWNPKDFTYADTVELPKILGNDQVIPDLGPTRKPRSTIMHNKFLVMDRRWLWTGSTNVTATCMGAEYNANNAIAIDSPELAQVFSNEFSQMFEREEFSSSKKAGASEYEYVYTDGTTVQVFFSPQDKPITNGVIPKIDEATESIDIAMFFLTHTGISDALIRAMDRGVKVRLIIDALGAANVSSQHQALRAGGAEVRVENWGGKMHMKTAIFDHQDVILGSMNWTEAGTKNNDENTMLIRNNPKLVEESEANFERLWGNLVSWKPGQADPRAESKTAGNSCFDGLDNDYDGLVDAEDQGCK